MQQHHSANGKELIAGESLNNTYFILRFYQILICALGPRTTGQSQNTKAATYRSGNGAFSLRGQLTLAELLKKKKVDEEKSSVQITRTQDGSEEAQLYNKDEHSSDEHKTPDTVKLLQLMTSMMLPMMKMKHMKVMNRAENLNQPVFQQMWLVRRI